MSETARINLVVFSDSEERAANLSKPLDNLSRARVAARVHELDRVPPAVRRLGPDALVLDLGSDPEAVLDVVEALPQPRPPLLVIGPQDDSRLLLRAMRLGAREYLPELPSESELGQVVERLLVEKKSDAPTRLAPVVAVMGSKGGVGATYAACQLGAALQAIGGRTAVVDLNLALGDVAVHFDLQPTYTLANVAREEEAFDSTFLQTVLQPHDCGVHILAASARVEEAELVGAVHVERTLQLLRKDFDWIVLDVSRSWNEASLRALDLADVILMVTLADVPTLNHARQHLDVLKRLGHPDSKIRILLNRSSKSDTVSEKDVEGFLKRGSDIRLANDYPTTLACVNQGRTLGQVAPRSRLHDHYRALARELHVWCEVQLPEGEAPGFRSWLRRLFRK